MRPVISYDDITPTQPGTAFQVGPQAPSGHPPLAKKRRTNQRPANGRQQYSQHWDDPGNQAQRMSYDEGVGMAGDDLENGEEGEESRELTHEEIWDDSVLVNAWDSAMAEYKVCAPHGLLFHFLVIDRLFLSVRPSMDLMVSGRRSQSRSRLCRLFASLLLKSY